MLSYLSAALFVVLPADLQAARQDYAQIPHEQKPYTRYLTTSHVPDRGHDYTEAAVKFAVPSASRARVLDRHVPATVSPGVYRIDLRELQWDNHDWDVVLKDYPYAVNDPKYPLLAIRGDWLVYRLADPTQSDAYYRLLYGAKNIPKTRDEFLKFWGVNKNDPKQLGQGWIETKSQVAKQSTRFIRWFAVEGGSAWGTQDVLRIDGKSDPLAAPDGAFKHDGEEWIIQIPKVSIRDRSRGALQIYLLANGQGGRVEEAPVGLVEDYTRFKGQAAIRNNGSCIQCHAQGMQLPTENGIAALLQDGMYLYAKDYAKAEFIDRFHLSDVSKQLQRDNEDYQTAVKACNGLTAPENAAAYKHVNQWYINDLSLEQAAKELDCTSEKLRDAIGYANLNKIDVGPRVAALAHGRKIPRSQFEGDYRKVEAMLKVYRGVK